MKDRETLITYLLDCARAGDWHGVSGAANDLREVDAEVRGRRYRAASTAELADPQGAEPMPRTPVGKPAPWGVMALPDEAFEALLHRRPVR